MHRLALGPLAHVMEPLVRSDLWLAWNGDPLILLCLAAGAVVLLRWYAGTGSHEMDRWKRRDFGLGILAAGVALVSPLNALSGSLASAHMVQHLLLTIVAAPLLIVGAPAIPDSLSSRMPLRRHAGPFFARATTSPVAWAALHAVAIWFWHARGAYDAALRNHVLHGVEHLVFFGTALISWSAVLRTGRVGPDGSGLRMLVLFGLSVQSALLGALLTFASTPWYPSYRTTTAAWGLTPLADQQLAGVIMWVPAGSVYLFAALTVLSKMLAPDGSDTQRFRGITPAALSSPLPGGQSRCAAERASD